MLCVSGIQQSDSVIHITQGLNPGLPHCRWILYQLSHQGSPLYIYMYPFFFRFFSHLGYYRVLRTVPCSRSLSIICFIYSNVYMLLLISLFIHLHFSLFITKSMLLKSVSLFCKQVHLYYFFQIRHIHDTISFSDILHLV